ncbi:MAG TPA: hypothetical protein VM307_03475 [Egibacteraceae bacterium]|nr:hypothetical protein [Egibacteraceae bacterium]
MSVLAQVDTSPLNNALHTAAEFLPKFLGFLAILIIGYFVAKVIGNLLNKVLERVGFDRAVERGGVRKALANSQYDASDIVGKLVFYTLFLFVLQMAFGVFGTNPISDLIASVIAYLPKIVVAIIIVVVAAAIATAVREIIDASLGGLSYGRMLGNIAGVAILALGVFAALNQLEIAEAIVNGLFYAILAVIAGSAIIAIGGGGIQPMRNRWENVLNKYDEEKDNVRREIENTSTEDLKARAEQRKQQAQESGGQTAQSPAPGATAAGGSPTIQLPEDQTTRR